MIKWSNRIVNREKTCNGIQVINLGLIYNRVNKRHLSEIFFMEVILAKHQISVEHQLNTMLKKLSYFIQCYY